MYSISHFLKSRTTFIFGDISSFALPIGRTAFFSLVKSCCSSSALLTLVKIQLLMGKISQIHLGANGMHRKLCGKCSIHFDSLFEGYRKRSLWQISLSSELSMRYLRTVDTVGKAVVCSAIFRHGIDRSKRWHDRLRWQGNLLRCAHSFVF